MSILTIIIVVAAAFHVLIYTGAAVMRHKPIDLSGTLIAWFFVLLISMLITGAANLSVSTHVAIPLR